MAECMAIQPYIKFPVHGNCATELCFFPKGSHIQNRRVTQLSSRNVCKPIGFRSTNLKESHDHSKSHMKCFCLGALINTDGAPSDWVPVIDQVLLMASVFLTHVAGVIPTDKTLLTPQESIPNDIVATEDTFFSGSAKENENEVDLKFAWYTVKDKLMDSINAIERGASMENGIKELEQQHARQPSSLCAVAEGPRFRLLWASFQCLKKEVDDVSRNSSTSGMDNLQKVFSEIIQRSSLSICGAWLRNELCLTNGKSVRDLLSPVLDKLNGNDSVLQNIIKSGKEDLYTELLCILRYGSLRQDCCYDYSFFTLHGVSVLEDLVITLADGIASMYLELISVDSNMSSEMNSLGLNLCTMSTRALQRLRNEVALNQWLYQNMEAVVAMYEDRFDLRTLQSQLIAEPSKVETEKLSWWRKISLRRSGPAVPSLRVVVISSIRVPVKRTKELRVLTDWRYYFSLFLESADITMPFIRTLVAKVSDAISFFLVCLIGRSLGLIYTGIRQSLRWK